MYNQNNNNDNDDNIPGDDNLLDERHLRRYL